MMKKRLTKSGSDAQAEWIVEMADLSQADLKEARESMRLSPADQAAFAQALTVPPEPNKALDQAFKQWRLLLRPQ